jgi:hypothetical protein
VRQSVADALTAAVEESDGASQSAFVERALIRELKELRRRRARICKPRSRTAYSNISGSLGIEFDGEEL